MNLSKPLKLGAIARYAKRKETIRFENIVMKKSVLPGNISTYHNHFPFILKKSPFKNKCKLYLSFYGKIILTTTHLFYKTICIFSPKHYQLYHKCFYKFEHK